MHPLDKVGGDVDQRIEREARNAAAKQLIDARLLYAVTLYYLELCPATLFKLALRLSP